MRYQFLIAFLPFLLMACSSQERLQGKRISVADLESKIRFAQSGQKTISLGKARRNREWSQWGGNGRHNLQHLAFKAGSLQKIWQVETKADTDTPLQAQPIIASGNLYFLDQDGFLNAYQIARSQLLWRVDIAPSGRSDIGESFGGGLAFAQNRLFIATAFGSALSVDSRNGRILWRKENRVPYRSAPSVINGRVYFLSFNNHVHVLDMTNGNLIWQHQSTAEPDSILMATAIAGSSKQVVLPYNSGEVFSFNSDDYALIWTDNFVPTAQSLFPSSAGFVAPPVMDDAFVYLTSNASQMVAVRLDDGQRLWTQNVNGVQMPWLSGKQIYILANDGFVLCLNKANGLVIWRKRLPKTEGEIAWFGPVLAGGALFLSSSQGSILALSPKNGRLISHQKYAPSFQSAPMIVDEVLYLISSDNKIMGFGAR